jgi:hypothetical protein
MWLLNFYRFYASLALGVAAAMFVVRQWWFGLLIFIIARTCWTLVELFIGRLKVNRLFKRHAYEFKQQLGPYGIRMINKAETDAAVRRSLAEVFTENEKNLRKAVENLEVMDTLFRAGMRPDGDAYQLHDLKLKYGKYRIERMEKEKAGGAGEKM